MLAKPELGSYSCMLQPDVSFETAAPKLISQTALKLKYKLIQLKSHALQCISLILAIDPWAIEANTQNG